MMIEELGEMRLAYLRRTGRYGAGNKRLMEQLKSRLRAEGLFREDTTIFGIALDDPAQTPEAAQRYDVGVLLTDGEGPRGLPVRRIAGGRFAVFEIAHTEEAVSAFWRNFPESVAGLPWDSTRPVLERYTASKVSSQVCELCVPLRMD